MRMEPIHRWSFRKQMLVLGTMLIIIGAIMIATAGWPKKLTTTSLLATIVSAAVGTVAWNRLRRK